MSAKYSAGPKRIAQPERRGAKRRKLPGVFVAGRLGYIDFRPLDDGLGDASPTGPVDWDNDVTRYEASLGYRIVRNAGVLLSVYEQIQANEVDADSRFAGIRLWWAF